MKKPHPNCSSDTARLEKISVKDFVLIIAQKG